MTLAAAAPETPATSDVAGVLRAHNQTLTHAIRHALPVLHALAGALDAGSGPGPEGVRGVIADLQGALDSTGPSRP